MEAKLLNHHTDMENSLEGLWKEVHSISVGLVALEVSSNSIERLVTGGIGIVAPTERERTHHSRGFEVAIHGLWCRLENLVLYLSIPRMKTPK